LRACSTALATLRDMIRREAANSIGGGRAARLEAGHENHARSSAPGGKCLPHTYAAGPAFRCHSRAEDGKRWRDAGVALSRLPRRPCVRRGLPVFRTERVMIPFGGIGRIYPYPRGGYFGCAQIDDCLLRRILSVVSKINLLR
jgi:hypothetical protein